MKSRFAVPQFSTPSETPEFIARQEKPPQFKDQASIEIFCADAHLHIIKDEDSGVDLRGWHVWVWVRAPSEAVCRLSSWSHYKDGDTPTSVSSEFTSDVLSFITRLLAGEE